MKKTNALLIVAGTLALGVAAFSAGVTYALEQLKKIRAEDLAPADEDKNAPKEATEE